MFFVRQKWIYFLCILIRLDIFLIVLFVQHQLRLTTQHCPDCCNNSKNRFLANIFYGCMRMCTFISQKSKAVHNNGSKAITEQTRMRQKNIHERAKFNKLVMSFGGKSRDNTEDSLESDSYKASFLSRRLHGLSCNECARFV